MNFSFFQSCGFFLSFFFNKTQFSQCSPETVVVVVVVVVVGRIVCLFVFCFVLFVFYFRLPSWSN